LEKLHKAPVRLNLDERPATAHLFIANPLSGKGVANLFSTHPPVEERVKRLKAMTGMPISDPSAVVVTLTNPNAFSPRLADAEPISMDKSVRL
jgi:hypothetical protein